MIYQFKVKHSEIKIYQLCLGNIRNVFTIDHMEESMTKRKRQVLFSVNYNPINNNDILDIQRNLMKETSCKIMFTIIKKMFIVLFISLINTSSIVNASIQTKWVSLRNQKCEIQLTLINLHPNEYSQELH